MLTGFWKRTLLLRICCVVQCHSLGSSCRVGGHGPRWHCHPQLHSGRLPCRCCCSDAGPPLSVLWETLLLHKLCCLLHIEGGYSRGPTVLLVSLPLENQADQGPHHHTIPIIVTRQSRFVTGHEYPIVHSPSKVLEAISISEVHPQVCISKHVLLLFLTSVPLHASSLHYPKNLIGHHAKRIKIVCLQLLKDKEVFIKHVHKYAQVVTGAQQIQDHAHLPLKGWGVKVCHLLVHMAPQVLIALAEPATEAPMEDHIKSGNKSQQT